MKRIAPRVRRGGAAVAIAVLVLAAAVGPLAAGPALAAPAAPGAAAPDEGTAPGLLTKQEICREARAAVPHLTAAELDSLLGAGADLVLLDVRTEDEWDAGHIGGAVWLPRGFLEFKVQELVPDPTRPIVVYCEKGCRGSRAAATLREIGYRDVRDLTGGVEAWAAAGLPLHNRLGRILVSEFGAADPSGGDEAGAGAP